MSEPNYSLDEMAERATFARDVHKDYVLHLEREYRYHSQKNAMDGIPAVCLVGMGRAGKDTAGEYLSARFKLRPPKSSSLNALPLVATMAGTTEERAYRERHQNRKFWIEACNAIRGDDYATLTRWCLAVCDVVIGIRGDREFATVLREGVVDLTVWVDRDVPADPTVEFARGDCDVVVENHTTLERFHERLCRLGRSIYRARR